MSTAAESEIRQLIERWMQAVRDRDIPGIIAPYADDIVAFDAIQALQFKGKSAYTAHWEMCMGMCTGPMVFELAQLTVYAAGDLALAHWLNRCCRGPAPQAVQAAAHPAHVLRGTAGESTQPRRAASYTASPRERTAILL